MYEGILEMFQKSGLEFDRRIEESDRRFNEKFDRMVEETNRQMKKTHKRISELGSRIGDIIEHMVRGDIIDKFQALGYDVTGCSPNKTFRNKKLNIEGEIDLLLDDGDVAILISVKTTLETKDVSNHIEKIEEYRRYAQARGTCGHQRFFGAIAGAVVKGDAAKFAQQNGMYVIVQSGKAVEIVPTPKGFVAKEW